MKNVDFLPYQNPDSECYSCQDREDDGQEDTDEEGDEGPAGEDEEHDKDYESIKDQPGQGEAPLVGDGAGGDHEGESDVGQTDTGEDDEDDAVVVVDPVDGCPD